MSAGSLFLLIYAASGLAALIYEVVWTRLLTLHMGHTVAAASTVLAAFMGGLAIGAALGGRYAARIARSRAIRAYAALEATIAVCALLLPFALAALRPLLAWAYANSEGGAWFGFTRFVTSLLLVAAPAAAMGATFPVAAQWFVRSADRTGPDAGQLYAANTLGAALGALVAGFVLIPALGLARTTYVGVAVNVLAAASALLLARAVDARAEEPTTAEVAVGSAAQASARRLTAPEAGTSGSKGRKPARPKAASAVPGLVDGRPWLAATAVAISGFAALVYQVAWTRILALVIGPTTYAFGAMLAAFIGGLAAGAAVGSRIAGRARQPGVWLGLMLIIAAAGAFASTSLSGRLPLIIARSVSDPQAQFARVVLLDSAIITALLLPMTAALGAAFPLAVASAARASAAVSVDVAIVYTANTAGAIAGALAGGFALIPLLGLQTTVLAAGALGIAGGLRVIFVGSSGTRPRVAGVTAAALAAVVAWAFPAWDRELLSSGAYKYAPYVREPDLEAALKAGTLLYYEEGAAATVSVRRVAGAVSLAIDGKVDASNAGDMLTQKLLAHLPLLLHPSPREVAIVGLGSGVTLGAALRHPIARADMIEISPEVVEASAYFSSENHDALKDPRVRLILGDGRSHLLLASRRYDVIVSEPSNPWMAGIASLFTREFFEAARARLAPGGILCQWAHTYDISDDDLRSIAATFASVFPDGTMWLVGDGDLLLLGSTAPLLPRLDHIARAWSRPGVAADLSEVSARRPFSVVTLLVGDGPALQRYARGARLQTDDHAPLEFSAPRAIYGRNRNENAGTLRRLVPGESLPAPVRHALETAGASGWRDRGTMLLQAEAHGAAHDDFARAIDLDPTDRAALDGLARAAAAARRVPEARSRLQRVVDADRTNIPARIALSRLLVSQGQVDGGLRVAADALAARPNDPDAREHLASIFTDLGDVDRLRPLVADMERDAPGREGTLYYAASAVFLQGNFARAAELAEQALKIDPTQARARNLLGAASASLGQRDRARQAFQASLRANPRDPATYANLGVFELQAANPQEALDYFAEALSLDPESPTALAGLNDALAAIKARR